MCVLSSRILLVDLDGTRWCERIGLGSCGTQLVNQPPSRPFDLRPTQPGLRSRPSSSRGALLECLRESWRILQRTFARCSRGQLAQARIRDEEAG